MNPSIRATLRPWAFATGLLCSVFAGTSLAQQAPAAGQPATLPQVQSANIMDVGRASDATIEAQRKAAQNQPGNSSPIWRTVNSDAVNYVSIPDKEAGVLIQKSGQQWRLIRNGVITVYGAWLLALASGGILVVFVLKGKIKLHEPMTGKLIKRFTTLERVNHWTMAFSFIALAITGLLILYGKYFAIDLLGATAFSWLLLVSKNIHNFVGPLFTISLIAFFIQFAKRNLPEKGDWEWIKSFGGMFGGKHVPANYFNPGEKFWFWFGMVILGGLVSASGWVLDMIVPIPGIEYWRGTMQISHIIHTVGALLITAMAFGHMYIGSIGMQGSIDGMKTGYVDETWAKEHHEAWYHKVK